MADDSSNVRVFTSVLVKNLHVLIPKQTKKSVCLFLSMAWYASQSDLGRDYWRQLVT